MQEIKPVTEIKIVEQRTVSDQILELPIASIVAIESSTSMTRGIIGEVIQRTGSNAWLATRSGHGDYIRNDTLRTLISHAVAAGSRIVLLRRGVQDYV